AEDGIRDFHVTGVQTCALPISRRRTFMRIGIVGAGAMARIHGAAWNKLPVTLAGCYDRHPERAAAYCQEFGGQPYASLAELLAKIGRASCRERVKRPVVCDDAK